MFFRAAVEPAGSASEISISRASWASLTFGLPVYRDRPGRTFAASPGARRRAGGRTAAQARSDSRMTLLVADGNAVVIAAAGARAVPVGTVLEAFLRRAVATSRASSAKRTPTAQKDLRRQPWGRPDEEDSTSRR
jgi:hypothetical protein